MPRIRAYRVSCDQCQMLSINGVACHERGCPNSNARFDRKTQEWIKQRECFECGCTIDRDDPCCSAPFEEEQERVEECTRDHNVCCSCGYSCNYEYGCGPGCHNLTLSERQRRLQRDFPCCGGYANAWSYGYTHAPGCNQA